MKTINFNENNHVVRNEGLDLYMSQMNARKPLTDDEVRELIIKAQKGDERARNKVVEANLRIAWSIAAHYNGMDVFEDILQNANYGLVIAVDTYDVSRETKFSTWALENIRKYINIGLTDESRVVRQGAHQIKCEYSATSFDAPMGNDDGEDKTLLDFFASDSKTDNFSDVEHMRAQINYLMNGLKDKEKEIICKLFGFGCREYTQLELSMQYNYTEERIRQIKFEALAKMKAMGK